MKKIEDHFSKVTHPWELEREYQVNGAIAAGMDLENTLIVGADGFYLFDNIEKKLAYEDLETNISSAFNVNNSEVRLPKIKREFSVFGMRGGLFAFCTKHWELHFLPLQYGVSVPEITRKNIRIFLNPGFNYAGGFLTGSFSMNGKKIMLLTCEGLRIFTNIENC
jgi:hypothetical protein